LVSAYLTGLHKEAVMFIKVFTLLGIACVFNVIGVALFGFPEIPNINKISGLLFINASGALAFYAGSIF
jgi:hypothetical protein